MENELSTPPRPSLEVVELVAQKFVKAASEVNNQGPEEANFRRATLNRQ